MEDFNLSYYEILALSEFGSVVIKRSVPCAIGVERGVEDTAFNAVVTDCKLFNDDFAITLVAVRKEAA